MYGQQIVNNNYTGMRAANVSLNWMIQFFGKKKSDNDGELIINLDVNEYYQIISRSYII